jgi:integrase
MGRRSKQELEQRFSGGKSIQLTAADIALVSCPEGKDQFIIWDAQVPGLGVRVSPGGKKTFVVKKAFRVNGIRKDFKEALGSCLALTLEQARAAATAMISRAELTGMTPAEQNAQEQELEALKQQEIDQLRQTEIQRRARDQQFTLGALCLAYSNHLHALGKITHNGVRTALQRHVIHAHPNLAALPANQVTRKHIAQILQKMLESGIKAGVSKVRSYLVSAFNLAISVDGDVTARRFFTGFEIDHNPAHQTAARSLRKLCGVGNRVLNENEVRLFYREVCLLKPGPVRDVLIMNFYLGGQRTSQLLRVKLEDIDLKYETLRLMDPKGSRDRPRVHILPLVGPALVYAGFLMRKAILNGTEFLFASEVIRNQHVVNDLVSRVAAELASDLCMRKLIHKKFNKSDLRRTVETTLARCKVSMEIRGQLQSHGLSGVQIRHYDRHDYMDEKREALEIWQGVFLTEVCAVP